MNVSHTWLAVSHLIPLLAFLLIQLSPAKEEKKISTLAQRALLAHLLGTLVFFFYWYSQSGQAFTVEEFSLYTENGYSFLIDFYVDHISLTYLALGSFLTLLIIRFSSFYMHLEKGYRRFFSTLLFFFFAFQMTILSGNFETLFLGWEMLGMSSFLLIAFYRERYLPVRNAVKVFSMYRIGDVGILLAMWASHHLWHTNIRFMDLSDAPRVMHHISLHPALAACITLGIVLAALVKSAQFPFSSWLPRAMEGPTPSSAIFYGALAVHLGIFLLLRTEPFWIHQPAMRILIGCIGVLTAFMAYSIAKVQTTIKAQIAYASVIQIGLMFVEISLGWNTWVLFHLAGNALLRAYQLLISPSVVAYKIRDQFYHYTPHQAPKKSPGRLSFTSTLFVLGLLEWKMDRIYSTFLFGSIKKAGKSLRFVTWSFFWRVGLPLFFVLWMVISTTNRENVLFVRMLAASSACLGLASVLRSFVERKNPLLAWTLSMFSHFWIALAVLANDTHVIQHSLVYLSGVLLFGTLGFVLLFQLRKREKRFFHLNGYKGLGHHYPVYRELFLLSALGVMGFPISYTFIGEDLIFSHIRENQFMLALLNALTFVIGGISIVRIYARLFLGPESKSITSTALKTA
jgi:NADH-quinone oxidoreductase subunit L